jgi:hypothetical protein
VGSSELPATGIGDWLGCTHPLTRAIEAMEITVTSVDFTVPRFQKSFAAACLDDSQPLIFSLASRCGPNVTRNRKDDHA